VPIKLNTAYTTSASRPKREESFKGGNSTDSKDYLNVLRNSNKNPLLNHAKKINGRFELITLATIVTVLGFGLPKINEMMTTNKYKGKNKNASCAPKNSPAILNITAEKLNAQQKVVFGSFVNYGA
ncbi:hypothetical protein tpqmel_1064, partial [Candidatus Gastranaerophilus sp. (ex Termes propinquus)]